MITLDAPVSFVIVKIYVYVYTYMGTKTITITEDVYERLRSHKREGESFSDVVRRLTGGEQDVWTGFGTYEGDAGERLREAVDANRDEMDGEMSDPGGRVARALEETDEDR